jgi:hypothetical protein
VDRDRFLDSLSPNLRSEVLFHLFGKMFVKVRHLTVDRRIFVKVRHHPTVIKSRCVPCRGTIRTNREGRAQRDRG